MKRSGASVEVVKETAEGPAADEETVTEVATDVGDRVGPSSVHTGTELEVKEKVETGTGPAFSENDNVERGGDTLGVE